MYKSHGAGSDSLDTKLSSDMVNWCICRVSRSSERPAFNGPLWVGRQAQCLLMTKYGPLKKTHRFCFNVNKTRTLNFIPQK